MFSVYQIIWRAQADDAEETRDRPEDGWEASEGIARRERGRGRGEKIIDSRYRAALRYPIVDRTP